MGILGFPFFISQTSEEPQEIIEKKKGLHKKTLVVIDSIY